MQAVKCVVVGDSGVGKTWFHHICINNQLPDETPQYPETGVVQISLLGKPIRIGLWDSAGSQEYDRLRPLSYPQTDVFVITFSVASRCSFESVKARWLPEISIHCPYSPIILVGTKSDLRNDPATMEALSQAGEALIHPQEGQQLADDIGAVKYHECSALNKEGFVDICDSVVRSVTIGWNSPFEKPKPTKQGSCVVL